MVRRRGMATSLLVALALVAFGCSGGAKPSAPAAAPSKPSAAPATPAAPIATPLKLGILKIAGAAQVQAAETLGYYKEEGITVQTTVLGGGAEAIPLVEKGDLNITFTNHVSWMLAVSQGFDLVALGGINSEKMKDPWTQYIYVRKDSGIDSPKKLEGKSLVVNNLKNFGELYSKQWLKAKGVDISKVKYMEMPYPTMPDALIKKSVDAVFAAEPFGSVLRSSPEVTYIGSPYEMAPGLPYSVYVAKRSWAEANPDMVNRFVRAISKTSAKLQNDLAEQQKHVEAFTGMKPEVIKAVILEDLQTEIKLAHMQKSMDLSVEYGLLKAPVDLKKFIWKDAKIQQ